MSPEDSEYFHLQNKIDELMEQIEDYEMEYLAISEIEEMDDFSL